MLNKIIASAALAAATMATPAIADDAAATPKLTPDEVKTQTTYRAWGSCVDAKVETLTAVAEKIVAARANASDAATLDELKKANVPDEYAPALVNTIGKVETDYLIKTFMKVTNPQGACLAELKINMQELNGKIQDIVQKYGRDQAEAILARPDAAPKP